MRAFVDWMKSSAHVSRLNYELALPQPASCMALDISIDTWKDTVNGIKYSRTSMSRHTSFLMHLLLSKREKTRSFSISLLLPAQTYLCPRGAMSRWKAFPTIRLSETALHRRTHERHVKQI